MVRHVENVLSAEIFQRLCFKSSPASDTIILYYCSSRHSNMMPPWKGRLCHLADNSEEGTGASPREVMDGGRSRDGLEVMKGGRSMDGLEVMEGGRSSCICHPAAVWFLLFSLIFCSEVYFMEQTTSLELVWYREQDECLLLALRGVSVVTAQPVKQSPEVLRRQKLHFPWVKVLAQVFDWMTVSVLLKNQVSQQNTARVSLMIQAFHTADDEDRFILSQNDTLE